MIGMYCSFGDTSGYLTVTTMDGIMEYSGNGEIIEILSDTNNYFSYKERCCSEKDENLQFHNGTLLIIKPKTNTVYLSIWDF